MKKKFLPVLLIVTMLFVVILVGCAPPATSPFDDTEEAPAETAKPTEAPKATEVQTEEVDEPEEVEQPTEPEEPEFSYGEAPMLAAMVGNGELPPVEERLPENPLMLPPVSEIGAYGGVLRIYAPGVDAFNDLHWTRINNWVRLSTDAYFAEGENGVVMHRAEAIDTNPTMTEFTVHLRTGMKWSDGVPVTSADVMFAVEDVWLNEELNNWWFGFYKDNRPVVTAVDDYTVKFEFPNPATDFLRTLAAWGSNQGLLVAEAPSHHLKQYHITYNPDAEEEAKEAGFEGWVDQYKKMAQIGSSQTNFDLPTINPWVLKNKTTTQAVYERNPYYWAVDTEGNQLPYIDGFIVEAVSDIEVAKLKLVGGDFDLAGVFLVQLGEYPLLKQGEQAGGYSMILNKGNATAKPVICPNINHKDPVLSDIFGNPDFRKALSYAIDRDEINEISFVGIGQPMQSVYTVWDYLDPTGYLEAYTEYNPEKAKELLDGMGLAKDANGFYLRPDGQPLTVNLQTITEEGWAPTIELVTKHWTDIGIRTQFSPTERSLFSERNTANELDMWIWHDYSFSEEIFSQVWGQWQIGNVAKEWNAWLTTDGEKGVEPPDNWKTHYEDVLALFESSYGSSGYQQLVKKVWDFRVTDQLFCIGTIGNFPTPLLVKTGLGNVGNNDVPFNYWQGQYVEQWYWQDAVRQTELVP